MQQKKTDWEHVSRWYHSQVSTHGHYYHQQVVLPAVTQQLHLQAGDKLLDVACGNGVLIDHIPEGVTYVGIDGAKSLIAEATKRKNTSSHTFLVRDAMKPFQLPQRDFTHATIILALQNIARADFTLQEIGKHLLPGGKLIIVLNHPYFRIPRQSSWEIDPIKKTQYRRIDRYYSPIEIPLQAHPGKKHSPVIWTYHHSLQDYTTMLKAAGFMIETIEELLSTKKSEGKHAKMENRSRMEFPLFMVLVAIKK